MRDGVHGGMSLLCLAFELFQLFGRDSQGLIFACLEIKAQDFNENGISLVNADGEINSCFMGVKTQWLALGVENSRSKKVSRINPIIWGKLEETYPSGKMCTICFPRINDAL